MYQTNDSLHRSTHNVCVVLEFSSHDFSFCSRRPAFIITGLKVKIFYSDTCFVLFYRGSGSGYKYIISKLVLGMFSDVKFNNLEGVSVIFVWYSERKTNNKLFNSNLNTNIILLDWTTLMLYIHSVLLRPWTLELAILITLMSLSKLQSSSFTISHYSLSLLHTGLSSSLWCTYTNHLNKKISPLFLHRATLPCFSSSHFQYGPFSYSYIYAFSYILCIFLITFPDYRMIWYISIVRLFQLSIYKSCFYL